MPKYLVSRMCANKKLAKGVRSFLRPPFTPSEPMELKLWALILLIIDRDALRRPRPGTQGWVLDAGANDGATSFMLANALRRHGGRLTQVLAVEPLPNNVIVAQGHARRAGNMHVVHAGLGDVNGSVGYYPKHLELRAGGAAAQIAAFRPGDACRLSRKRGHVEHVLRGEARIVSALNRHVHERGHLGARV